MRSDLFPDGVPRLNHVALSLDADALDADARGRLCDFYGHCFGWQELPSETVDRRVLVLAVGHWDQFLFLHAEEQPMRAPNMDHFGVSVASLADFGAAWQRVAERAAGDPEVEVLEPRVDDFGVVSIHAFYVRYALPMMIEVQFWDFVASSDTEPAAAQEGIHTVSR